MLPDAIEPPPGVTPEEWADITAAAEAIADASPPLSRDQADAIALLAPKVGEQDAA